MAFESKVYSKPGKPDRTARTPSEKVQLEWDGYKVKTEAKLAEVPAEPVENTAPAPTDQEKAAAEKAAAEAAKPAEVKSNTAPRR